METKYNIDRNVPQGGDEVATKRVAFCLDQIEQHGENLTVAFDGDLIPGKLTLEEVVGALVAAEQAVQGPVCGECGSDSDGCYCNYDAEPIK